MAVPKRLMMSLNVCAIHNDCHVLDFEDGDAYHLNPSQMHWLAAMLAIAQRRMLSVPGGDHG